ncbi:MAG: UpxY family transcription antiterminator [Bacteroidales bacterium]|nr:UpxY family transcription antiterminator [Bacteroidales bacterium]
MNEPFWHILYVKPRTEKIVQKKLEEVNFNVFLPLVNHLRVYKTAKKKILLPLFTGYIFVFVKAGYRHQITAIPEVYRFIKFRDEYAKISDEEIINLKLLVNHIKDYNEFQSEVIFQSGSRVEVTEGPFRGMKGRMIMRSGKRRIVIAIEAIKQSISVEINATDLRKLECSNMDELAGYV